MRYAFIVALIPPFMPAPLAALVAPVIAGAKALGGVALRGLAGQAAKEGLGAAAKEGAKGAARGDQGPQRPVPQRRLSLPAASVALTLLQLLRLDNYPEKTLLYMRLPFDKSLGHLLGNMDQEKL